MKKLFAILAIAGLMVACNNKKKEEKKSETDTTIQMPVDTMNMPPVDSSTLVDTTSHM